MKKGILAVLIVSVLLAGGLVVPAVLSGCDPGGDVVFVQTGVTEVGSVLTEGKRSGGGICNADGSLMLEGDSFSISAEEYGWPMTLTACRGLMGEDPIASLQIPEAAAEGERWFVFLVKDGAGYQMRCSTTWPLEE